MKWITEHWNKLLAILAVCIGGTIGLFGAVLIFQVQIGALHGELDSLKLMIKGLESVEQSSLVALSKANKALESSKAAQELTKTAGAGRGSGKRGGGTVAQRCQCRGKRGKRGPDQVEYGQSICAIRSTGSQSVVSDGDSSNSTVTKCDEILARWNVLRIKGKKRLPRGVQRRVFTL